MSKIPSALLERFAAGELVAAIAQDVETKEVLMMAWMNQESLKLTLDNKRATYWSRSRNSLWVKGESSGHFQDVVSITFDCDSDCLLLLVKQTGAACHTGERSCFHSEIAIQ
ncbi:MAG: phosphoribosyl-AMP cyclohydrolase [Actinobacteria bacterium]|uniref:Histidine biosynthesis bifunctional protein HisIE n=1 Tax=freshwater metagenome TaxID=449393 RepID=A0A6J7KDW0_9ZZZZ|nr:phosphoribosyl-AMP cyclohydrolase [Actinomycetota bacterium]MSZ02655.1 phosphoribosyl-AMP cyclohydrolase [Actinomycetota bacterium]